MYDFEGDHCIIKEGYAALSSRVAATLDIQLNTEVRMIRVDDAQSNVEVVVKSGGKTTSMRAGYVVVTLPLGVLKSRLVSYSKAINAHSDAYQPPSLVRWRQQVSILAQQPSSTSGVSKGCMCALICCCSYTVYGNTQDNTPRAEFSSRFSPKQRGHTRRKTAVFERSRFL